MVTKCKEKYIFFQYCSKKLKYHVLYVKILRKPKVESNMSDKIDGNNPVNFKGAYSKHNQKEPENLKKEEAESVVPKKRENSDLGIGVYGRAQVTSPKGTSKNILQDIDYLKNNPELVAFCGEMFDHYAEDMSYIDAVEKAHSCADVFKNSL